MHRLYIILISIILEVYNVLNRKYFDNFSFINFIYVIKVFLFLLIYFIKVYIVLFQINYLFYFIFHAPFFMHLLIIFRLFVCSKCTIQSHIINFQPFLTSFVIFHAFTDFFWAIRPWNWKAFEMNSEKVPSWHGIIISPT